MAAIYRNGFYAAEGDIVRCMDSDYSSIRRGETATVLCVEDGCIVLNNRDSPHGTSPFKASNFGLAHRASTFAQDQPQERQEKKYMHFAIRTDGEGFSFDQLAKQINDNQLACHIIADTNGADLKQKIRARIETFPDEVWLILGGHTIASGKRRPSVDVSFRSV